MVTRSLSECGGTWGTLKFGDTLNNLESNVSDCLFFLKVIFYKKQNLTHICLFIQIKTSIYWCFFLKVRPFLYVDESIDLDVLYQFMITEWKLYLPNMIIPVLSGMTNHKPFKNLKMVESLRGGIKNVSYLSVARRRHFYWSFLDNKRVGSLVYYQRYGFWTSTTYRDGFSRGNCMYSNEFISI